MDKNKAELEWKNHSPFFINLNDDLKRLKIIGSNKDMNNLRVYYDELYDMNKHYSPYLKKKKDIKTKLRECNQSLYSREFSRNKWSAEFHKKMIGSRDTLNDIHELIIEGLFDNGLIPRFEDVDMSGPAVTRVRK